MKEIPLTQGQVALVDDADYEYLNQWKWFAYKKANTFYARRNSRPVNGKRTMIHMHVEILGRKEGLMTDHINGNGLDNRRENLRHATVRQNQQNQHVKSSSEHPGVCWVKRREKWQAGITINGKCKHLGYFTNELEAAEAYNKIEI